MFASAPIHQSNPAGPRQMAGASLLAFIAFVYFALVVSAVAVRGDSQVAAGDVSVLTSFAPYAIALAVAHGLVAHFAMSANAVARRIAYLFALAGAALSVASAIVVAVGFDPYARTGANAIAWDGVGISLLIAAVYGAAAFLLHSGGRSVES